MIDFYRVKFSIYPHNGSIENCFEEIITIIRRWLEAKYTPQKVSGIIPDWDEFTTGTLDTVVIDSKLETVGPDPAFEGIRAFVAENMDSFKTAYAKPRGMLATYVNTILGTYSQANDGIATPVNFLRG